MPLILYPEIFSNGVTDKVHIFNSTMAPLMFTYSISNGIDDCETFPIMWKSGDDLRQDQVVVQLISLMDRLLKNQNLDLKLTFYRVLATDQKSGMLELVSDSMNIAKVIMKYGTNNPLRLYLKELHPDPNGPYGIKESVLDTFLRSVGFFF